MVPLFEINNREDFTWDLSNVPRREDWRIERDLLYGTSGIVIQDPTRTMSITQGNGLLSQINRANIHEYNELTTEVLQDTLNSLFNSNSSNTYNRINVESDGVFVLKSFQEYQDKFNKTRGNKRFKIEFNNYEEIGIIEIKITKNDSKILEIDYPIKDNYLPTLYEFIIHTIEKY